MRLGLKIRLSTSFDKTRYAESSIYTKNILFLLVHSLLFLVNNTGVVKSKIHKE